MEHVSGSFDRFAKEFDELLGNAGDYTRKHTIDPMLFRMLGVLKSKKIYDVACGNGYLARKYIKKGAKEVWASDISPKLIEIAQNKYSTHGIKYFVSDAVDFRSLPKNYFDIVTVNMAIFHIYNLDKFFKGINGILKSKGRVIFTFDHPLKQVAYSKWGREQDLVKVYEKYLSERLIFSRNHWLKKDKDVPTYVRPLSVYINALSKNGLLVKTVDEPVSITEYQGKRVNSKIPFKMAIEAVKV